MRLFVFKSVNMSAWSTNLLQLVESMDFIHEQNGVVLVFLFVLRNGDHLFDVIDAGHGGRQFYESYALRLFASIGDDMS